MRLHRFIKKNIDLMGATAAITDKELIHQITSVLRLGIGDHLILSDGVVVAAEVEIASITKETISVTIVKNEKSIKEENRITLFVSIPKKDILERIVQMTTELGVRKIVPVICERTVKTGIVLSRLEKIAREATELSGRMYVPHIDTPTRFQQALLQAEKEKMNILLLDKNGIQLENKKIENIAIFIGPEGGFTKKEIALGKESGASIVSLGAHTLRVETAAVASISLFS